MNFNRLKYNKSKFNSSFKNQNLFRFNLNIKDFNRNSSKLSVGKIFKFFKFKIEENLLKVHYIKSKIIKITQKNNLIKLNFIDLTTKIYKQGIFTLYLNSPIITSLIN
nr:hypothetical protein [Coccidia sp. AB-2023a]